MIRIAYIHIYQSYPESYQSYPVCPIKVTPVNSEIELFVHLLVAPHAQLFV